MLRHLHCTRHARRSPMHKSPAPNGCTSTLSRRACLALLAAACSAARGRPQGAAARPGQPPLQPGDLVFTRIDARPFVEVAAATLSWTNHVGIVVAVDGGQATVAESTLPLSRRGPLEHFVARSEGGRVAVMRLATPPTAAQAAAIDAAARQREGVRYDTGFDLHSSGQFCSRFVHEVLLQATGVGVGEVQSFETLLRHNPQAALGFWRLWFLGRIPWQRQTVTPASVLASPALVTVFDGVVQPSGWTSKATSSRDTML